MASNVLHDRDKISFSGISAKSLEIHAHCLQDPPLLTLPSMVHHHQCIPSAKSKRSIMKEVCNVVNKLSQSLEMLRSRFYVEKCWKCSALAPKSMGQSVRHGRSLWPATFLEEIMWLSFGAALFSALKDGNASRLTQQLIPSTSLSLKAEKPLNFTTSPSHLSPFPAMPSSSSFLKYSRAEAWLPAAAAG